MNLQYEKYPYSPILGWSISRHEVFDKCKRQYFYSYYSKFVNDVPHYKIARLRELTSVPLEIGTVVHDVIEAFLRRLQKNDSAIDRDRFFQYAHKKADEYFSGKTFLEVYYGWTESIDSKNVYEKIDTCLDNFISSPRYSWIFMKAVLNRGNWMIEPAGYGETRLNGMKAYCKMDFLFPVGNEIHILDWKTGSKDHTKHRNQLIGYAAAASKNFNISWKNIYPKIIYLYPQFDELELQFEQDNFDNFYDMVHRHTEEMYSFCSNHEENIPLPIEKFPMMPSPSICRQCKFQELCFPDGRMVGKQDTEMANPFG